MKSRLNLTFKESHDTTIEAKPSFDKPGEQKLFIGVNNSGERILQLFLTKEEALEFQKQLDIAIQHTEWKYE